VLFRPVSTPQGRRALNPLTGEILPSPYIGQMVPGTGYTCGVITPTTPCQINGIVTQKNDDYVEGARGFIEPIGIQFDPRLGMAYALNRKTVIRAGAGAFHDSTGGPTFTGGPAFRFEKSVRYTDMNSFMTGTSVAAPIGVSGTEREGAKRPVNYRYTAAVQRDIGWKVVLDLAYVGDTTRNIGQDWNFNAVPAGARFRPENRDVTVNATATNPGALPDAFLRPITGFGDINISRPVGKAWYNSLQMQVSRRFTGRFETHGSYTWAKGTNTVLRENNPLPSGKARNLEVQEHVVVASYQFEIPNGSTLVKWRPARWVLDDWSISGITTLATGQWSNISASHTDNFDFSGGGDTCGNFVMTRNPNLPRSERTVDRWFDTAAFQRPSGRGDIGNNCYNGKIELPGFTNHDLSLFKNVRLKGSHKMQFRWEIYNLFNTPQWNGVDTSAQFNAAGQQTDVNFGTVTSARTERRMQLSLRYSF
jgi:hypothetical protein